MIEGLKPYPAYKQGAISWLDKTPATWEKRRLKTLFLEVDHRSKTGQEKLLSLRMHRGLVGHIDVGGRPIPPSALVGFKKTAPGQLVMNRMRAMSGLFAVTPEPGLVSPDYAVFDVREGANPSYFSELFKTPQMLAVFRAESKGLGTGESGFLRLYSDRFGVIPVAVPPPDEQAAIVKFLGHADRRIRRYIRTKQKLIKLLEEQKQAIVQGAVTRGLVSNVRMKPSGVEWLVEIPEHWDICRLKQLVTESIAGPYGSSLTKGMYVSAGYRVYGQQQVIPDDFSLGDYYISPSKYAEMIRYRVYPGDLLVSVMGTVGRAAVVPDQAEPGIINPRLVRYRPDCSRILPRYMQLAIMSKSSQARLREGANGSTMDGLNMGILGRLELTVPPLQEQREIVTSLDMQTLEFTHAQSQQRELLSLVEQFRTRLVADVITGKLDVRKTAASLRDEPTTDEEPIEELDDDTTDDELEPTGEESDE